MTQTATPKRLLWKPGVVQTAVRFSVFLAHVRDLRQFRAALREGGWAAAAQYTDYSEAELRACADTLGMNIEQLMEALPGVPASTALREERLLL